MSKTLTKEELVRANWLVELRRQGHRQCRLDYSDRGDVCALGLLGEVARLELDDSVDLWEVGELAGLDCNQSVEIASRNDGGYDLYGRLYPEHTFAEIADIVEGWFKKA